MRALIAALATVLLAACNPLAVANTSDQEIDRFHQRWNAGQLDTIWRTAHPEFRTGPTKEQFINIMTLMGDALGDTVETEREGIQINTANGTTTTQIQMRTTFANGEGLETFTLRGEGDALQLLYYNVQSPLLDPVAEQKPEGVQIRPAVPAAAGT